MKRNTERMGFGAVDQTKPSRKKYECLSNSSADPPPPPPPGNAVVNMSIWFVAVCLVRRLPHFLKGEREENSGNGIFTSFLIHITLICNKTISSCVPQFNYLSTFMF